MIMSCLFVFFFKQKTAYEMRISDWSQTCALPIWEPQALLARDQCGRYRGLDGGRVVGDTVTHGAKVLDVRVVVEPRGQGARAESDLRCIGSGQVGHGWIPRRSSGRSEEHTSELQSLMRISYAVFCLKKKNNRVYIAQP